MDPYPHRELMTKTLLVDTNRAAVPIYRALESLGHEVWVVGAKPAETLARLADHYVELDYSDTPALAAFVDEKGFDHLVPGCTDLSYEVCAEVNRGRFPGIDTPANVRAINSKREFRRVAASLDLSVPGLLAPEQAVGRAAVIVKPVDSFSGRGMTVLRTPDTEQIKVACAVARQASKTGEVLIEEFVQGQLYSHSAYIWDGAVVADFIVQEDCTTNPFTVDTSQMARGFPRAMIDSLRADICRLALSLHLVNGLAHTQFIVRGDRYWIIEMTRRCPGDLYSLLIELSTGYPYAASYAAPFVGGRPCPPQPDIWQGLITRHTVTSREGTSLFGFQFNAPVDIQLFIPLATSGDYIGPSPFGRAGIFFFRSPSPGEQDILYQKLLDGSLYSFR